MREAGRKVRGRKLGRGTIILKGLGPYQDMAVEKQRSKRAQEKLLLKMDSV